MQGLLPILYSRPLDSSRHQSTGFLGQEASPDYGSKAAGQGV